MSHNSNATGTDRFAIIRRYLARYRGYLILGGLSLLLTNGFMLLTPYVAKIVVDLLEQGAEMSEVGKWSLIMVGLAVIAGVFRFMTRRTIIWMSRRIEYGIRGDLVAHLLRLPCRFYDNNRIGDLMVRLTSDIEAVRQMIGPGIMQISNTMFTVLLSIPMMIYLSPRLTLYALAPAIVLPILVNRLGNLVHRKSLAIQEHFSRLTATVQENISGIRVVKAYRQEDAEIRHFDGTSRKYFDLNLDMGKLQALFYPLLQMIGLSLTLAVVYFGGRQVIGGDMPLGTIVAFIGYLSLLLWPMMAIGWVVSLYQRGSASMERINKIFDSPPEEKDGSDLLRTRKIQGRIEFRNLRFGYNGRHVLKGVSLTINPGETIGLLGLTGSGKTTLISLLGRLYPVDRGQIFIDNHDINDWPLDVLRRHIGFATQEPFLFSDTIGANIAFGQDNADPEAIAHRARIAALDKDIETFPDKFDTVVGERGITLSGGQKQRTTIARALLGEPAILVLDDAASSVDTETEHQINERTREYSKEMTTIVISHRVSSVKEADRILFLEDGRVVEEGTHDQLMARDGRYADLYRSQLLALELEQL
ncbi:MAG: ABC transporter ATP-binding protein [Candidatus Zixiibacteriota bacterium]|nr:MAG: ABC transporter ATP-binding protein [candidate division Zixibacteria bacterium]